jgi:arginyl-tRNA synthetase
MKIFENLIKSFEEYISNSFDSQTKLKFIYNFNTNEKRSSFGDFSSNIPMILSNQLKQNVQQITEKITNEFSHKNLLKIEIAGSGFLNFFVKEEVYTRYLNVIKLDKTMIFEKTNHKINFNIEFVSANPTGPLHFGHGRGAIIGDTLSKILKLKEHKTTKEFYINDAGKQIQNLGQSLFLRYQEQCGVNIEFPDNLYAGEYVTEEAKKIHKDFKDMLLTRPLEWFTNFAGKVFLQNIKNTLSEYGIKFDNWFSEKTLHQNSKIEEAIEIIKSNKCAYEKDGCLVLESTKFGDDKDRVIKKSNGEYTYIAADIAYLKNKNDRGFDKLVIVLGHDHHGYVQRLKAALAAMDINPDKLDVILYQLVTIKNAGKIERFSKRSGNFITLQDVIDTVGKDASRFFYLNKKAEGQLEFDIEKAREQNQNNPVYYIQYAIVRIKSIFRKGDKITFSSSKMQYKFDEIEKMIIRKIASFNEMINAIESSYQTHMLAYYTYELSSLFHSFYYNHQCVDLKDKKKTEKRLLLAEMTLYTLEQSIELLGMESPDVM